MFLLDRSDHRLFSNFHRILNACTHSTCLHSLTRKANTLVKYAHQGNKMISNTGHAADGVCHLGWTQAQVFLSLTTFSGCLTLRGPQISSAVPFVDCPPPRAASSGGCSPGILRDSAGSGRSGNMNHQLDLCVGHICWPRWCGEQRAGPGRAFHGSSSNLTPHQSPLQAPLVFRVRVIA